MPSFPCVLRLANVRWDELKVVEFSGREAVSTLFEFDILCVHIGDSRRIGPDQVLGQPATLSFLQPQVDATPREIIGIIVDFVVSSPDVHQRRVYRFRLAPTLAKLTRRRSSIVLGSDVPLTVADILRLKMKEADIREDTPDLSPDIVPDNFRVFLTQTYPTLDHVMQYEETDFAFLSRLCEYYGIYYVFEPRTMGSASSGDGRPSSGQTVIFLDNNQLASAIDGNANLTYHATGMPDRVHGLEARCGFAERWLSVRDYNDDLTHLDMSATIEVDPEGQGVWHEYGYYRTPDEGWRLAQVRAEEHALRRYMVTGQSAVTRLVPGRVFSMVDHPYRDWNRWYFLLSVEHRWRSPGIDTAAADIAYSNSFTAIPSNAAFRPERRTPLPRVPGLLAGIVEGAISDSTRPFLDGQGRYRVRLSTDLSPNDIGKASRWIRKAEPYGGRETGLHFPLPPGTRVIIACLDGNPDRPVIIGAVNSSDNPNVVIDESSNRNMIRTRSGITVHIYDE